MIPDVPSPSPSDTHRLIRWLEEQRQVDHERLVQLMRSTEQMQDELRDHGMTLAHLTEDAGKRDDDGRDETINTLGERLAVVERALAEHLDAATRLSQIQTAQRERELRQFADLSQQVDALGRTVDANSGRTGALVEELRHLRDERAPLMHAVDEIQRAQSSLQSRVTIAEEVARRFGGFQSLAEQSVERQRNDLVRLDNQQKLLDLRLTRELNDVRQIIEEWMTRGEDRLKPIAELIRQIAGLAEQGEVNTQRTASLARDVEMVSMDFDHLDAQTKIDRGALKRYSDGLEAQGHRLDEAVASLWQLSERLSTTTTNLEGLRGDVDAATQRIDAAERRIARLDEERQRLASALSEVGAELHSGQRDSRDQSGTVLFHIDSEVSSLRAEISSIRGLAVERLRRTVGELQHQLHEMEAEQA